MVKVRDGSWRMCACVELKLYQNLTDSTYTNAPWFSDNHSLVCKSETSAARLPSKMSNAACICKATFSCCWCFWFMNLTVVIRESCAQHVCGVCQVLQWLWFHFLARMSRTGHLCGTDENRQLYSLLMMPSKRKANLPKPLHAACVLAADMNECMSRLVGCKACMRIFSILSIPSFLHLLLCIFSLHSVSKWTFRCPLPTPPLWPATGQRGAEVPLRCRLTCTNTTVCFICLCWFCFTLYWATLQSAHPGGPWAVGGPRGWRRHAEQTSIATFLPHCPAARQLAFTGCVAHFKPCFSARKISINCCQCHLCSLLISVFAGYFNKSGGLSVERTSVVYKH